MQGLGQFWRAQGRLGKTLVVVMAALVALGIVGAIAGGSDGENGNTDGTTEASETTETTGPWQPTRDPIDCLEEARLNDAEKRASDRWRAYHDSPFYQVNVQLLPTHAEAVRVFNHTFDVLDVSTVRARRYVVTGPLDSNAEGARLSDTEVSRAYGVLIFVGNCIAA